MSPRNNYLEQLRAKQEAARDQAGTKPVKELGEMSDAELDQEAERLRAELRRSKEALVEAGRQELQAKPGASQGRRLFPRRSRRPWK